MNIEKCDKTRYYVVPHITDAVRNKYLQFKSLNYTLLNKQLKMKKNC